MPKSFVIFISQFIAGYRLSEKVSEKFCCSVKDSAVAQWLRCCATNRKVAGSIPDGVIGIFH